MNKKLLLALVVLCATGCNADPGARREIAMLRAEIQDLEDSYYRLKSQSGDESARKPVRKSQTLNQFDESYLGDYIEYPPSEGDIIYENEYSPSLSPQFTDPQTTPNRQPAINPQDIPEEIDIQPTGGSGQSSLNRTLPQPRSASTQNQRNQSASTESPAERPAELVLDSDQTITIDTNGDGKPDGIQATFALRKQDGSSVSKPAKLIFSLLDPALPNGNQRIGFWEHTTSGAAPMLSLEPGDDSEQVFLPWQSELPSNGELLLFVRHMRSDGTALESTSPVLLDAPSGQTANNRATQNTRSAGKAPEINIDTRMLEQNNAAPENRRPLWRATR